MLNDLKKFIELLERFQSVERTVSVRGSKPIRWENDIEHSYILAMCAWYLNDKAQIGLNTDKLLRYALVHDLVEAYAGDVSPFGLKGHKGKYVEDKTKREQKALRRIQSEFPEMVEMYSLIHAYEERKDAESRFIYSLDKLLAPLEIYMDDGRAFHHYQLVLKELVEKKRGKIDQHDLVSELWQELVEEMEEQEGLFPELSNEKTHS